MPTEECNACTPVVPVAPDSTGHLADEKRKHFSSVKALCGDEPSIPLAPVTLQSTLLSRSPSPEESTMRKQQASLRRQLANKEDEPTGMAEFHQVTGSTLQGEVDCITAASSDQKIGFLLVSLPSAFAAEAHKAGGHRLLRGRRDGGALNMAHSVSSCRTCSFAFRFPVRRSNPTLWAVHRVLAGRSDTEKSAQLVSL